MKGTMYGYIRVSSRDQNADRQLLALRAFGVAPAHIYIEKQSGKDFNRPQYRRMLRRLHQGDLLVVKSIDRLGRNYEEILAQWRIITREKRAEVIVLDIPLLDTRQGRDLTGTLIADIVLELLSYVAQTEREFIRQRQREGIDAALTRGVKFGAPALRRPEDWQETLALVRAGELSIRKAGERLGVSHTTVRRWMNQETKDMHPCKDND